MKTYADKGRSEREFVVGDWVLLKLKPHRQVTLRLHKKNKLSPKYYGPFEVIKKCGAVAYELSLPQNAAIHNVFHVSQLKAFRGQVTTTVPLPNCSNDGLIAASPVKVLERKIAKVGNRAVVYWLTQWSNGSIDDATWEVATEVQAKHPSFDPDA